MKVIQVTLYNPAEHIIDIALFESKAIAMHSLAMTYSKVKGICWNIDKTELLNNSGNVMATIQEVPVLAKADHL